MTIQKILLKHKPKRRNLIKVLHEVVSVFGWISKENLYIIADYFNIPASNLYGIITSGEEFKTEKPKEIEVVVCNGASCKMKGSDIVLREVEKYFGLRADKSNNPKIKINSSTCLGRCNRAPVLIINGTTYENVKPYDVDDILRNYY